MGSQGEMWAKGFMGSPSTWVGAAHIWKAAWNSPLEYKPLSRGLFSLSLCLSLCFICFFLNPSTQVSAWHIVSTLTICEEKAARGLPISIAEGQAELKVPQEWKMRLMGGDGSGGNNEEYN